MSYCVALGWLCGTFNSDFQIIPDCSFFSVFFWWFLACHMILCIYLFLLDRLYFSLVPVSKQHCFKMQCIELSLQNNEMREIRTHEFWVWVLNVKVVLKVIWNTDLENWYLQLWCSSFINWLLSWVGSTWTGSLLRSKIFGIRIRDPNPHLKQGQIWWLHIIRNLEVAIDFWNAWKSLSSNRFVWVI